MFYGRKKKKAPLFPVLLSHPGSSCLTRWGVQQSCRWPRHTDQKGQSTQPPRSPCAQPTWTHNHPSLRYQFLQRGLSLCQRLEFIWVQISLERDCSGNASIVRKHAPLSILESAELVREMSNIWEALVSYRTLYHSPSLLYSFISFHWSPARSWPSFLQTSFTLCHFLIQSPKRAF